jgi:hypothetical protein
MGAHLAKENEKIAANQLISRLNPKVSDLRCLCGRRLKVVAYYSLYLIVAAVPERLRSTHLFAATTCAVQHSIASLLVTAFVSCVVYPARLQQ